MAQYRVLLIEDTRDDEALTLRGLHNAEAGAEILVARDGAAALEALGTLDPLPDLVLLDLKLPKIDGIEVLRRIRGEERTRGLCVVVFTSSSEPRDIARAYAAGCNSYVVKPVAYENYIETVRQIGNYWLTSNLNARARA